MRTWILPFAVLALIAGAARGETGYVNDQLEITLRTGESTRNSIVGMLSSGDRLDILSVNAETGYSHVRTLDGAEGYVLSRYVTGQPVARDRLDRANQRLASLEAEQQLLNARLTEKQDRVDELEQTLVQATESREAAERQLAEIRRTAANALNIASENDSLRQQLSDSQRDLEQLQSENLELADHGRQYWFAVGAGAVLAGILLGLLLPRLRLKRRSSWGEL